MQIKFFKEKKIKQSDLSLIVETLTYKFGPKDSVIFQEGERGDKLYIIIEGEVQVSK